MPQHLSNGESQPIMIFYEVASSDAEEIDPGELQAVADTMTDALRKEGYAVEPVPTGARGLDTLFQIIPQIFPFLQASAHTAITHKDEIMAAVKSVTPLIERIEALHKERLAKKARQQALGGIECEVRFGSDYDNFKFTSSDQAGSEQFLSALELFIEHSEHAKEHTQERIVDAQKPSLTIRERIPPRPRRRTY